MGNTLHVFIPKMLMVQNNICVLPTFLGEKKIPWWLCELALKTHSRFIISFGKFVLCSSCNINPINCCMPKEAALRKSQEDGDNVVYSKHRLFLGYGRKSFCNFWSLHLVQINEKVWEPERSHYDMSLWDCIFVFLIFFQAAPKLAKKNLYVREWDKLLEFQYKDGQSRLDPVILLLWWAGANEQRVTMNRDCP